MHCFAPFVRLTALAMAIAAVAACSSPAGPEGSPPVSPASAPPASGSALADVVSINAFKFQPARLSVTAGTTVTWTNEEDSLHTVTAGTPETPSGLFDSGEIDTGVDFSFRFDEAGTYPFFCARHDFMRGEVTVGP